MKEMDMLIEAIADRVADKVIERLRSQDMEEYSYSGISGIMAIFHCGRTKAQAMKRSGLLDDAIIASGKTFVIDKQRALRCVGD